MSRRAFTLIELLVVVTVIAILAAIGLPNYIEAQTRAKVTRALADLQTMRVAAESYHVDAIVYPRMSWGAAPFNDQYEGQGSALQPIYGTFGNWVTTPLAYLQRFDFLDPFAGPDEDARADIRIYTYHDLRTWRDLVTNHSPSSPPDLAKFEQYFGNYALMSVGPDRTQGGETGVYFWLQYDPTNGTSSPGNIWRGQKFTDSQDIPNIDT